jgi:DNA-binding transcriptional LysR family regulator
MELRHLRYFVAVAEELHFGRAAERLRIAQPPLSRQIRDLERELGAPLFERGSRGVELTPAGSAFLPEARLTIAQAERAQRTAQRAARGETGRLRVGFVDAAMHSEILPEVLAFFRMHLPSIGLSLLEMDTLQQADALREGRIDLGIVLSPPPDAERWLRVESVYADPLIAVLPRGHRLASRSRLSLGELSEEAFVFLPRAVAPPLYDEIIARCRAARFSPHIVQEAMAWHTIITLVSASVGVAFTPRSLRALRQPGVVFRPVRDLRVDMELSAIWQSGVRLPVRERFLTALKTVARAKARFPTTRKRQSVSR